jgi:membrane protease YdiL (CAAX protease family)
VDSWQELLITALSGLLTAILGLAVLGGLWIRFRGSRILLAACGWLLWKLGGLWIRFRGSRIFTPRRLLERRLSWQGIDVGMIFFITALVPGLVHETLKHLGFFDWLYGQQDNPATRGRQMLWSSDLAEPLMLALILLGLHCVRRSRLVEFGLTRIGALPNVAFGYLLWLVLTPAAHLVLYVMVLVTPPALNEPHWLAQTGQLSGLWPVEWVLLTLGPVVLAPLLEELMFRGILLPWQLRRGWDGQATVAFFALIVAMLGGVHADAKADPWANYNVLPVLFVLAMLPGLFVVPNWRKPPATAEHVSVAATLEPAHTEAFAPGARLPGPWPAVPIPVGWQQRFEQRLAKIVLNAGLARNQPRLAIFTNGLLFAAMHSAAWPSPVPLFLLGLGLAWLKVRTNSLVGCLTLHALFNFVAVLSLLLANLCGVSS